MLLLLLLLLLLAVVFLLVLLLLLTPLEQPVLHARVPRVGVHLLRQPQDQPLPEDPQLAGQGA